VWADRRESDGFIEEQWSVSQYIRRQRLERCRADLIDPRLADRSISSIAHGWGFGDLGGFNRVFRATFEATPRDIRGATDSGKLSAYRAGWLASRRKSLVRRPIAGRARSGGEAPRPSSRLLAAGSAFAGFRFPQSWRPVVPERQRGATSILLIEWGTSSGRRPE
jgi:hypothetical protein